MTNIAKVLLPYHFNKTFDYLLPENNVENPIEIGSIVQIPFGNRSETGVVFDIINNSHVIARSGATWQSK